MGVSREEALATEASVMSMLFHYREPVCGFRASERRLLRAALMHETDPEIASFLGISTSAVKKGWAAVFGRVAEHLPEIVQDSDGDRPADGGPRRRGPQKRHRLMAYVREHPEELRP
jgi:hypothetical protein